MPPSLWPSFVEEWGSTAAERDQSFPCDGLLADPDVAMYRAVDVQAPVEVSFRWLCQLRAAPYSYDRLDNLGRRSPQELTPGLHRLQVGQRVQTIFKLVEFEPGSSLTMVSSGRLFGLVACTYRADPVGPQRSRLIVKIGARYTRGIHRPLMKLILPPGDLVMMRRQLLNLKGLAERTAREGGPAY